MTGPVQRTIEAEARAIEEGHRAVLDLQNGGLVIVSDELDDVAYRVGAVGYSCGTVTFDCQPIDRRTRLPITATHGHLGGAPGCTACKHAALAARRLEREGFVVWTDDGWQIAPEYRQLLADRDRVADPFATFPKF